MTRGQTRTTAGWASNFRLRRLGLEGGRGEGQPEALLARASEGGPTRGRTDWRWGRANEEPRHSGTASKA